MIKDPFARFNRYPHRLNELKWMMTYARKTERLIPELTESPATHMEFDQYQTDFNNWVKDALDGRTRPA